MKATSISVGARIWFASRLLTNPLTTSSWKPRTCSQEEWSLLSLVSRFAPLSCSLLFHLTSFLFLFLFILGHLIHYQKSLSLAAHVCWVAKKASVQAINGTLSITKCIMSCLLLSFSFRNTTDGRKVGISWLNNICNPRWRCSAGKGANLNSWIEAHETGHR